MKRNSNKIILIEPPFFRLFKDTYSLTRFPLSLAYLAGTIKKETNWEVLVYNADFHPKDEQFKLSYIATKGFENYLLRLSDISCKIWADIKSIIEEYKPDVVGISAKSQNFASVRIVAKLAKQIDDSIIVVVGGPHPSMVGSDVLKCRDINVAVQGEGEKTIVELLNAIEAKKSFHKIKGVIYRENGRVLENGQREYVKDLDSLCFPHERAPELLKDYATYPLEAFRFIFATRGCPYRCFFCGSYKVWSRKVRFRSVDNVIREIKDLQKKGLRFIHFDDDIFGVNKRYLNDLCDALYKHCPGIKWSCEIHVKLVDEPTISRMKASGCYSIQIGIESGNNEILKKIGKNITIEEAISACKIIKKHGISLNAFFIVGFPQETEETLKDTIQAIKKIKCDSVIYSIFTPYPSTPAFEFCRENDLISKDFDMLLYSHKSPENCFCINLSQERFRGLVSEIEKTIDRKNWLNMIRRMFSIDSFKKMQELGITNSLQKGIKIIIGR